MAGRNKAIVQRSPQRAWALTIPMLMVSGLLVVVGQANYPGPIFSKPLAMLLYFGLFCAAEATILNIEVRRHAFQISVTDAPLLLAFFYLSPVSIVLTRLLALVVVQAYRRIAPVKTAFNIANVMLAASVGALIAASYKPFHHAAPPVWIVLIAAVTVSFLVGLAGVIGVITLVQGPMPVSDLVRAIVPVAIVGEINVAIGLAILIMVQYSVWSIVLIIGLAAAIALLYRTYAQFLRQHKSLAAMYDLTRALAESPHGGALGDVLLRRVQGLLHAEYATLWLPATGRYPESTLSARADDRGLLDMSVTPALLRHMALDGGSVIAGPKVGTDEARAALRTTGIKDAIVVPLRSSGVSIGTLEVAGRMHESSSFTQADVRLLETIAAHTSVALENDRLVDRLRFDAYHDSLTGLPNRRRGVAALDEAVKVPAPDDVVAAMIFDVNGMRDVNESLGRAAGDRLLVEFSRRLRANAPSAALVSRVGGDEFLVTIRAESVDAATAIAVDVHESLRRPMEIGSLTLDVDAAVGLAVHPDHGSEPEILVQRADVAAHIAKSLPSSLQVFDPSLESQAVLRLGLAADLRRAIDAGQLEVYFQPKVSLATRELLGVECLARWEHQVHGAVAPQDFVAVAEHTGQLGKLTDFVLREGLRRCREWSQSGRPLPISVNLSPRSVNDADFPDRIEAVLAEYGVAPEMLTLEITEDGVVGETDRPLPTLHRLRALGVRLSVDDFGTGYSSLSYLRKLPVDEIKIDRAFVQGMATDPGDLAIVNAVVDLARHFGLSVVAEGVESELTLSLLADIGCDVGQGFLFSRPLPFDRLEAWLAAQTDAESTAKGEVRRLRSVP